MLPILWYAVFQRMFVTLQVGWQVLALSLRCCLFLEFCVRTMWSPSSRSCKPHGHVLTSQCCCRRWSPRCCWTTAMSLYGLKHSELYWEKAQVILLPDRMSRRFYY